MLSPTRPRLPRPRLSNPRIPPPQGPSVFPTLRSQPSLRRATSTMNPHISQSQLCCSHLHSLAHRIVVEHPRQPLPPHLPRLVNCLRAASLTPQRSGISTGAFGPLTPVSSKQHLNHQKRFPQVTTVNLHRETDHHRPRTLKSGKELLTQNRSGATVRSISRT